MGTPLGGYGSASRRRLVPDVLGRHGHAVWFKPSVGTLDPLAARALVLEDRRSRLVWVTLDAIAVDRAFTERVRARLGGGAGKPTTLIVSATHTHSGPGAFLQSWLMGVVAADRFDDEVREAMLAAVAGAVRRADERRGPARVATATVAAPPLTKSRLGQPLDSELIVMKVTAASGAPIALVWNHAIHGTMQGPLNLAFSGDVMGLASSALERDLGVPALFVNGAVGDVSPRGHGREAVLAAGTELAAAVRGAWSGLGGGAGATLAAQSVRVPLPSSSLSLRNCVGGWVPRAFRLPLYGAVPREAELTAVAVGDTVWLAVPGELETRLGLTLKRAARARWAHAFVAGMSNDYLGYFVTAAHYDRPSYVTCANFYGREGGDRLTAAGTELLRALARRPEAPGASSAPGER